jgi:hypothetical protein
MGSQAPSFDQSEPHSGFVEHFTSAVLAALPQDERTLLETGIRDGQSDGRRARIRRLVSDNAHMLLAELMSGRVAVGPMIEQTVGLCASEVANIVAADYGHAAPLRIKSR